MSKVFVPNRGPHDYSAAWDFGELIFCTEGTINRRDFATMQATLEKAMQSATEEDFILLTSLTSLCAVACSIFAVRFGCLNLLVHEDGEYLERFLTFEEQEHAR